VFKSKMLTVHKERERGVRHRGTWSNLGEDFGLGNSGVKQILSAKKLGRFFKWESLTEGASVRHLVEVDLTRN
jgi:hypothetical protein